jgi:hexosaminidase
MILSLGRTPVVWEGFSKEYDDRIDKRTIVIAWESYYQLAPELAEAGFTLINCSWKPLYIVTPDTHWTPEEIAALDPWQWDHWMQKSPAYNYGIRIDRSKPVLGEQLCAWGDRIAGWENPEEGIRLEMELVSERLPALCRKLWHLGF